MAPPQKFVEKSLNASLGGGNIFPKKAQLKSGPLIPSTQKERENSQWVVGGA